MFYSSKSKDSANFFFFLKNSTHSINRFYVLFYKFCIRLYYFNEHLIVNYYSSINYFPLSITFDILHFFHFLYNTLP